MSELSAIITNLNLNTDKNTVHSYVDHFYEHEFKKYQNKNIKLLELGVDQGGSMLLWANYFKNGEILGVDIEFRGNSADACKKYPNITLYQNNAYDYAFISTLPAVDILIDDGPHSLESQLFTVKVMSNQVAPGGMLIIEDIQSENDLQKLLAAVPLYLKSYTEVVDLRSIKNRYDDLILVIRFPNDAF